MVSVAKDREALRFLWVDDPQNEEPKLIHLRYTKVVFGVSFGPFLLNATIAHHLDQYVNREHDLAQKIRRAIYVDDITFVADDDDSGYDVYLESKEILAEGGFNLRTFVTNSADLR